MFHLSTKDKTIIAIAILVSCCIFFYMLGHVMGVSSEKQSAKNIQQETQATPQDTRLGISAALFIPNFNAFFPDKLRIVTFQSAQEDFIEFPNTTRSVIIIGKGDPQNLDSVGAIFFKYDDQAYSDGIMSIAAIISAVSPSTTDAGRYYIIDQLGLHDNINEASGMKISDYNGKRYVVSYEGNKVMFSAMTIPPQ